MMGFVERMGILVGSPCAEPSIASIPMTESSAASPTMIASEQDDPLAKVRAQFDRAPYPRIPLDRLPSETHLYWHDFRTAYYRRNQKIASTEGRLMLDVGCGSGYGVLTMALANPGARIVGVDLSPASVELAKQRLEHHGLGDRVEFHALPMDALPQLGLSFDYINCDELLYLQPDPAQGLAAMKAVLKPDGIIRSNLHSLHQRNSYFKAQELAGLVGLMDDNPGSLEVEVFQGLIGALKDSVRLKPQIWDCTQSDNEEKIMMNLLFQRDRGFTIPQMFDYIHRADLDFISMTDWQSWSVSDLFTDMDDLPLPIALGLSEASIADQLHLHDLVQFNHRLLDFWCGHLDTEPSWISLPEWEPEDWYGAHIYLHPQLNTEEFQQDLTTSLRTFTDLNMNKHLSFSWGLSSVSNAIAVGLVPLLDGMKTFEQLVDALQVVRPIDPVTAEPIARTEVEAALRYLVTEFERSGYIFIESAN
jgi:2-polyprenyl-3-methyl-5-hydroxy-6-metoxy-1,4-benzoquinol methylase